jgi:DedD protein
LVIPEPPERDFETRVVPLDAAATDAAPSSVAEAIGVAPQEPATTDTPVPAGPDAIATVDTQAPTRIDAVSGEAVSPVATIPPVTAPAPAPTTPPAAVSVAVPKATTVNPPSASTAPATAASGRFLVALGSYSNAANANALATQLRTAGYKVLSDSVAVNGQSATRLRIGPYATRGQAEAARLAVKQLRADLPASISEIDDTPATDAPATARSAPAASAWAVQIGAFKVETEANTKRDQLRQAGFAAFIEKINADAGVLWRVRIGPENQRADADAVKAGVKRRFNIDGIVVPYP